MFKNLTYRQKNRFLIIAVVLGALVIYQFAFKRTLESFKVNKELTQQIDGKDILSTGAFDRDTYHRLNSLIDKYSVDSAQWENNFWFTVSDIAAKRGISVVYEANKEVKTDSLNIMRKQVQFSGNYAVLIQLLDSLEKNTKAGFLSGIELKVFEPASSGKPSKIIANSEFSVISEN